MQNIYKAENSKRERVSVSNTCLSVCRCLLSSSAPYLRSVTYYLVLTTLRTYAYFIPLVIFWGEHFEEHL